MGSRGLNQHRRPAWRPLGGVAVTLCLCASAAHAESAVSASAGTPKVSLTPTSLTFVQAAGRTSRNQVVTLTNDGTGRLVLGQIAINGPHAGEFAREISSNCISGGSVEAGSSCVLAVNFTPAGGGERKAELVIPHSASASPATVALRGNAGDAAQAQ